MSDQNVLLALKGVVDPELGVNIVDLGLVYRADLTDDGIEIAMTMTTPTCPLGEMLVEQAETALRERFPEASAIRISLLRTTPWSPARITEEGRIALGWPPSKVKPQREAEQAMQPAGSLWKH